MNNAGIRIMLTLALLALVTGTSPARAETYIVEPIADAADAPPAGQGFSQAELDQMLAPIALYPDALLSQVLIAATYPLEIVEAARWSRQNPQLSGEDAVAAVADREWDPSVKSLVAFPDLLARMDEDLEWTRRLGDAMLFQEAQLMDSIQLLRARADEAGTLESTEYVKVIRDERTIVIEPTRTRIVHVPYYDPYVAYGTWWWPSYRPVVWAPPAYYFGYGGYPGFYWGTGVHISTGFFYSSFYWPQRSVVIVHTPRYYTPPRYWYSRPYYKHYRNYGYTPGQKWRHNPIHRRGVAYRQPEVRERYVRYSPGSKSVSTSAFKGSQRPPRDGAADNRGHREDRGGRDGRQWSGDAQRSNPRNQAALPDARGRTERAEQRFTQPRGAAPSTRSQHGARPDAASLERRLGASRDSGARSGRGREEPGTLRGTVETRNRVTTGHTRSTVAGATSRTHPQAVRPRAGERSLSTARSPRPAYRSTAPARVPQATRPQAPQRATVPAPAQQASPPPAASRSAPAPAARADSRRRPDSGGSSRGNGGARESRARR